MTGATTGKTGIGVVLQVGDGESPPVFASVANVTNMEVGGITLNMIDATHLGSPDFYSEFLPGLKTSQPWTATIQWDPSDPTQSGDSGLRKYVEDRTKVTLRVDPSAVGIDEGFEADGYVQELGNVTVSPEAVMTMSFNFQPTGRVRIVDVSE